VLVAFLVVLYGLALPYVGLMGLAFVGLFRRGREPNVADRPSISVVLPAHDEERHLPGTLASLCAQRYPGDVEFVIVDDRSQDRTAEIIADAAARDPRVRAVRVEAPDRRLSPKVNAVAHGIAASTGEIIVTTDADCRYPEGWLEGMAAHFGPGVTMVVGYVETTRRGTVSRFLHAFETIDWLSLMIVSRSLTRFGWKFASSANNQAYRRDAFEAAGGFGASGRAPSGDEDLLTQRLGRLDDARIVFASRPETRVLTHAVDGWRQLFRQRRRWVSRYHHPMHYHPGFLVSIALLGFQSIALAGAILAAPFLPALQPWVIGLWGTELAIMAVGVGIGARQLGRDDLLGPELVGWALLHPFFIAAIVIGSFLRDGAWTAGRDGYRRRWVERRLRAWRRRLRDLTGRVP
jgi:cellulose synthase/poly-beta-1,6-N-acetylglucosamine synthase-like glycosyltransferase